MKLAMASFNTLMFLLLLVQPLAHATNVTETEDDFHKYIPPPLPESKWEKYPINYTELHEEFSSALTCVFVPFGVFGCFVRLVVLLLCVIDFLKHLAMYLQWSEGDKKGRFMLGTLFSGAASTAWSLAFLIPSYKSLMECSDERGFGPIRNAVRMDFAAALFATIACGFTMIAALPYAGPALVGSMFFDVLAFLMVCLQHMTLLFDVTRSAGVTRKLFFKEQFRVNQRAYLVASIIEELILLPLIIPVGFFGATANVFLGNVLGDPWGSYYLKSSWGKAMAVLAGLGIFVEAAIGGIGYFLNEIGG